MQPSAVCVNFEPETIAFNMAELTSTSAELLVTRRSQRSLPDEFLHSAAYAMVQSPVAGIAQMIDHCAGTTLLPSVSVLDAPEESTTFSAKWHAQTAGAMVGMTVPFLLMHKTVGKIGNLAFGKMEANATQQTMVQRMVAESAITGAMMDGLFRPVQQDQLNDFWKHRVNQGVIGAITFGVMTRSALALRSTLASERSMVSALAKSDIGSAFISGIPAGLVNAELTSKLNTGHHASLSQFGESIYSFSVLGAAVTGGKRIIGGTSTEKTFANELAAATKESDTLMRTAIEKSPFESSLLSRVTEAGGPKSAFILRMREQFLRQLTGDEVQVSTTPESDKAESFHRLAASGEVGTALRKFYPQLANEGTLDGIARHLRTAMREPLWQEDLSTKWQAYEQNDRLARHFEGKHARLKDRVTREELRGVASSEVLSQTERIEAAAKKYRTAADRLHAEVHPTLTARANDWSCSFNTALRKHNLPPLEFVFENGGTAYDPGGGRARLAPTDFLAKQSFRSNGIGTLHEYLHFLQDLTVLRQLEHYHVARARHGIAEYDPQKVKDDYLADTKGTLSDTLLRIGQQENRRSPWGYSREQHDNKQDLAKAFREYPSTQTITPLLARARALQDLLTAIREDPRQAELFIRRLNTADANVNIFRPAQAGSGLRTLLFPSSELPAGIEQVSKSWLAADKCAAGKANPSSTWSLESARSAVLADLRALLAVTNCEVVAFRDVYFTNLLERQAFTFEDMVAKSLTPRKKSQ